MTCPGRYDDLELIEGGWIACEHPERPFDELVYSFPYVCLPCEIATDAALKMEIHLPNSEAESSESICSYSTPEEA